MNISIYPALASTPPAVSRTATVTFSIDLLGPEKRRSPLPLLEYLG
jgi:hypothetical protein